MNKSLSLLLMLAAFGASSAWSQAVPAQPVAQAKSTAAVPFADGEIRKVDKENRKLTIKHGEIKNLDMPAMTMVYLVSDAALLDKVKQGDKVRFKATHDGGKLTVTEIVPAK